MIIVIVDEMGVLKVKIYIKKVAIYLNYAILQQPPYFALIEQSNFLFFHLMIIFVSAHFFV